VTCFLVLKETDFMGLSATKEAYFCVLKEKETHVMGLIETKETCV